MRSRTRSVKLKYLKALKSWFQDDGPSMKFRVFQLRLSVIGVCTTDPSASVCGRKLQQHWQVETRNKSLKLQAFGTQSLVELQEVALVIIRRKDAAGTGMRHQAHQQVVMRRRSPGSIRPTFFKSAKLSHRLRARPYESVVAAAVKDIRMYRSIAAG